MTGKEVVIHYKQGTAPSVPEAANDGEKYPELVLEAQEKVSGSLPQFVQLASHTDRAKIRGLKPDSVYNLKVNS